MPAMYDFDGRLTKCVHFADINPALPLTDCALKYTVHYLKAWEKYIMNTVYLRMV